MLLRGVAVKEVMSEPVVTVAPDASVRDAARLMLERRIGCLPVVDAGVLVGLVTETDLLRSAYGP
jgi:CBS domain-containing protein